MGVSPAVDPDHTIPLNELAVGVRQGRFYVRWLPRDLEVQFTTGHMLNSMAAPSVFRFLSEISRDGIAQLSAFDWGPASAFAFLPRVQSGRSILDVAQWRLDAFAKEERAPIENAQMFTDWFNGWRERWQVPQRVYLSTGDNRLLYDLDDMAQVDELRGELHHARQGLNRSR